MKLFYLHSQDASEPYLRASFSIRHRIKRLVWIAIWMTFCRFTPVVLHGWRSTVLRCFGAKLGKKNLIYPKATIWAPWNLVTGDIVTIANGVEIYNPATVTLEHHAILSQDSFLCCGTHDYNHPDFPMIWRPIHVGAYGWICARATVLPGVTAYDGAVLGAAAVTSRNLEAWTVYAGNPAKKVAARKNIMEPPS